jgi:hypothetical protein
VKPLWWEAKQSWAVDVPAAKSPTGKRQRKLFETRDKARDFCGDQKEEQAEHGRSSVTAEDRHYIGLARSELGDLSILPEVLRHWRRTGTGAISAMPVEKAVELFKAIQFKRVGDRTKSDGGCVRPTSGGDLGASR